MCRTADLTPGERVCGKVEVAGWFGRKIFESGHVLVSTTEPGLVHQVALGDLLGSISERLDLSAYPKVVRRGLLLKFGEPIEPNEDSGRRWHPGPLADLG